MATPAATFSWPHKSSGHITGVKFSEKCHLVQLQSVHITGVAFIEGGHITGVLLYLHIFVYECFIDYSTSGFICEDYKHCTFY